jgi:hypothetical protein
MASAGYAVLFPMPRGGSGYGEAGHRMIINDWGGPDYKDIMAGVDDVIARGIADPGSPWRDGRVLWRLHDQLDRHADIALQRPRQPVRASPTLPISTT